MADDKKPAGDPIDDWLFYIVIIVPCILLLAGALFGINLVGTKSKTATSTSDVSDTFSLSRFYAFGSPVLGSRVINANRTPVRNMPAGSIVGHQKKLEVGRLMEGPVEQFGVTWYRVDYPQAPDGWVETKYISEKVGVVRTFNIVPLLYGFYKPIGYGLLLIMLVVVVVFWFLLRKEKKITEKKRMLKDEQFREAPRPIEQLIADKPDVQELPGFRTEEIVPIQIAEQNSRWTHIQDLIKSYNPSDWRQAIIEADIILEEMLDKMGYKGTTIGEKLKTVERSDFITLDRAWSAHKVRNQIAHDGSSFKLSRELAERTIKDFEEVFREFYYI